MDRKKALDQLRLMQAWHEDNGNGPNADYDAICYAINIIEEMPEERTETHACDCISRQAAIDAIENAFDRETILNRFVRKIAISAVRLLQPVQPELPIKEKCAYCPHCSNCDVNDDLTLKQRTGKWVMNDHIGTFKIFTCSECGWNSEAQFNFCPNCGVKMETEVTE
jgi:hypothetical protein